MIVQCGSCKTRFKISDEKVTDRGVKVRCSKCGTVFVVKKGDGDEPMSGASPGPKPGAVPLPGGTPPAARAASSAPFDGGGDFEEASTRVAAIPKELLGASIPGADPFADLGAADPFAVPAPDPFAGAPDPFAAPQRGAPDPFAAQGAGAADPFAPADDPYGGAEPPPPPPPEDPFGKLGLGPPARVPGMAEQIAATAPSGQLPSGLGKDPFAGLDLGSQAAPGPIGTLTPPPPKPSGQLPTALMNDDPFAGIDLVGGGRGNRGLGPPPPPDEPPAPGSGAGFDDPFAHIDFGDRQAGGAVGGGMGEVDDALGGLPPPPQPAPSFPAGAGAMQPMGDGDPFGAGEDDVDLGPRIDLRSGREVPADEPPPAVERAPELPREELAQPGLTGAPAQGLGRLAPPKEKAPAKPEKPPRSPVVSALNAISGIGLVLMALIAFVVYRNDGKLDLRDLDVDTVLRAFGLDLTAEPGASAELVPADISNGLYATSNGKHVFYVRGQVKNRGTESKGPAVRVAVELLGSGSKAVARAESWAGGEPTPEQVHQLDGPGAWQRLALETGAAKAGPVAGGASSPFLVVFADVPAGLEGLKVRVLASPTERPAAPPAPPGPVDPKPPAPEKPPPHKGARQPKPAAATVP